VKTTDGFATVSAVNPNLPSVTQLLVFGPDLFAISSSTAYVFAMKLDNDGNIVWSTYFGGSGSDQAVALAIGADRSLYITASTNSVDLPGTAGAFPSKQPSTSGALAGFVRKLNPGGALAWASWFTESNIGPIAVDSGGIPFITAKDERWHSHQAGRVPDEFPADFHLQPVFQRAWPHFRLRHQIQRAGNGAIVYSLTFPPITTKTPFRTRTLWRWARPETPGSALPPARVFPPRWAMLPPCGTECGRLGGSRLGGAAGAGERCRARP
jgi:hypothetical protein